MKKLIFLVLSILVCGGAHAAQSAWDYPNANMAGGSSKPGFAQLTWTPGTVLPIKLREGMVTMVNLPEGESIVDAVVGQDRLFQFEPQKGSRTMLISPVPGNSGNDTNMIVTGKSGNNYIFYLRPAPVNSGEITYSMVDIVTDPNNMVGSRGGAVTGNMGSIFPRNNPTAQSTTGTDGEDYSWIKTVKIDPTEFRFDLDIFVPNPDDFVIAPERVWRDRIFTYIDFGDKVIAMTQRPVVSLLIEGGESPVGFRTDGENGRLLIVEAVGDMVLRSGQRLVCIKKRAKPFLIADTGSVMALAESNVRQSIASNQSLNNAAYLGGATGAVGATGGGAATGQMMYGNAQSGTPNTGGGFTFQPPMNMPSGGSGARGINLLPAVRNTAGAFLPQSDIPLIPSNQVGVAVELKSDPSIKALNDYWTDLMARFSGGDGQGILTPYRNMVFFAVDEAGVGDLGSGGATARLYRLRVGPFADIDEAQKLCDKMLKFNGTSCSVVRVQ